MNFIWLIYCDINTPADIVSDIRKIALGMKCYELVFVNDFNEMLSHLKETCGESGKPYVITSRLDNDDAIGKHYIENMQDHFIPGNKVILNPLGGVNYDVVDGVLTYHGHSILNSFSGIIEETTASADMHTIMGFPHLSPPPDVSIKNIKSEYAFWMNLHPQNAGTRKTRGWPIFTSNIIRHYTIDPSQVRISIPHSIFYALKWFPRAVRKKIAYKFQNFGKYLKNGKGKIILLLPG